MAVAQTPATANPLSGLYDFVRAHLLIANNLLLAAGTLVAALDFLAPRLSLAPTIVYSATAALLLLMVAAAVAPAWVGRLMSVVGFVAMREGVVPLWRRPAWQFAVALLLGVSVLGWASVARASQGGWIASKFPAARSLQESMLSLSNEVADIRQGVDAANGKLDGIVADSKDPQRELVARGYDPVSGLDKAIRAGDAHAVDLFVKVGAPVRREAALAILFTEKPFASEIAAKLPRSMFGAGDSCKAGFYFAWGEIEDRLAEQIATFKRLCDPAPAIANIEADQARDRLAPPPNAHWAHRRAVRDHSLALLRQ